MGSATPVLQGLLNATQVFGKIKMLISIIVGSIVILLSTGGLIYTNVAFERGYVTKSAIVVGAPSCVDTLDMNGNWITAGNVRVQIKGETKVFNVSAGSRCHNLFDGYTVQLKFDPSKVDSTIFLASEDVKAKLNVILSAVLVFFSITVIISALLLNNKAAQTAGGVLGVIRMM